MQNYLFSVDCANHSPRFLFYIAILSTFLTTQRCTSNLNLGTNYKITFHPPALRLPLYRRKPVLGTWSRDGQIIPCFLGLSETKNIKIYDF